MPYFCAKKCLNLTFVSLAAFLLVSLHIFIKCSLPSSSLFLIISACLAIFSFCRAISYFSFFLSLFPYWVVGLKFSECLRLWIPAGVGSSDGVGSIILIAPSEGASLMNLIFCLLWTVTEFVPSDVKFIGLRMNLLLFSWVIGRDWIIDGWEICLLVLTSTVCGLESSTILGGVFKISRTPFYPAFTLVLFWLASSRLSLLRCYLYL
jgi:hypothetical protein